SFRWNDSVDAGTSSMAASAPGVMPWGPAPTSALKMRRRIAWARAASEPIASFSSMFPVLWKNCPKSSCGAGSAHRETLKTGQRDLFSIRSREPLQVMLGVAELLRDHRQPLEGVRHLHFLRHAHAAVQLDRLLADVACRVGDLDLGRRDDAPPLGRVDVAARGRVDLRAREIGDRARLLG